MQVNKISQALKNAEAIVIGAGAGLSASGGLLYNGERFKKNFADFITAYHFRDMYSAAFFPYRSPERYWAYMSRHVMLNRYDAPVGKPYSVLFELVKDKNYFVITTNVDHQFQKVGFDKQRLFYTQGDYGLWQCSVPCHKKTYNNEDLIRKMVNEQKNLCVPSELVPRCPKCGKPISMNLRCDNTFVQDDGWEAAAKRYEDFSVRYADAGVLYLELGVGGNTPGIIKYPFWQMAAANPKAAYACINLTDATCPNEIKKKSICIKEDIGHVLEAVLENTS